MDGRVNTKKTFKFLAIVGPTCSGKSQLAMSLAKTIKGEIVSCDSVQVYKGFNIGSAKPTAQDQREVQHHLLDLCDPAEDFHAAAYSKLARQKIKEVNERGVLPIVVGGTGLYYRALVQDRFDPLPTDPVLREKLSELSNVQLLAKLRLLDSLKTEKIHPNDRVRLIRAVEVATLVGQKNHDSIAESEKADFLVEPKMTIKLSPNRKILHQKIAARTQKMVEEGLVDEVQSLLKKRVSKDSKPMQSIGYKQSLDYLNKKTTLTQLLDSITIATRQYAKRQDTWFRKFRPDFEFDSLDNNYTVESVTSRLMQTHLKESRFAALSKSSNDLPSVSPSRRAPFAPM